MRMTKTPKARPWCHHPATQLTSYQMRGWRLQGGRRCCCGWAHGPTCEPWVVLQPSVRAMRTQMPATARAWRRPSSHSTALTWIWSRLRTTDRTPTFQILRTVPIIDTRARWLSRCVELHGKRKPTLLHKAKLQTFSPQHLVERVLACSGSFSTEETVICV